MNELNPAPVNRPGSNGNPMLEGVQTERMRELHDLNDTGNTQLHTELLDEAHGLARSHERVSDLMRHETGKEREQTMKEFGGALLRSTLNSDQAQVFAEAGKEQFETAIDEQKTLKQQRDGGFRERRKASKTFGRAYDAEHTGMVNGAEALAEAQTEAVVKERAAYQEQLVEEETKRAA